MSDPGMTAPRLGRALPDPIESDTVRYNPSFEELREYSSALETTTEFGSASYVSGQRSRNADRTMTAIDTEFDAEDYALFEEAVESARSQELVCLDRRMGRHPDLSYRCRLYVPIDQARIALGWGTLFDPVETGSESRGSAPEPDLLTLQLPDWDPIAIRVLPEEGQTIVLGSDYTGEAKKSFLRLFMYYAKQQGGLGLHAGTKQVRLKREAGDLQTVGQAFLGLSATGKSTLTAHGLWLDEPEGATMLQDDVCALLPNGTVAGSEGHGLYVKTHCLDRDEQPCLYDAVTHETAVLENVDVEDDGTVDFDSDAYTTNGRAVIERDELRSADDHIDLSDLDQLFFITRNPVAPPIAKLSPRQAAVTFMLGESIQTSAGDPSKAGESIRVVGTNPFIIGSEGQEGNRVHDLVADLDLECYLLNTGQVGDRDVGVQESVTILREVARGRIEWTHDDCTGLTVPAAVPGLDIGDYDVADAVDDHERTLADLRAERRAYLDGFPELRQKIRSAVY
jgi:phosphoenolpyruvate carboxykinase (ATP)